MVVLPCDQNNYKLSFKPSFYLIFFSFLFVLYGLPNNPYMCFKRRKPQTKLLREKFALSCRCYYILAGPFTIKSFYSTFQTPPPLIQQSFFLLFSTNFKIQFSLYFMVTADHFVLYPQKIKQSFKIYYFNKCNLSSIWKEKWKKYLNQQRPLLAKIYLNFFSEWRQIIEALLSVKR